MPASSIPTSAVTSPPAVPWWRRRRGDRKPVAGWKPWQRVYARQGQPWPRARIQATASVDIRLERLCTSGLAGGEAQTTKDSAMATVHSAFTDLLDPLGDCMTAEAARKVVQLR